MCQMPAFGPVSSGFRVFVLYFGQIVSQKLRKVFELLCESQLIVDLGILSPQK